MNLVTRFLAARRDKLLMKLGCWLVCFSLVLGLMLPQQKAEALVTELAVGSVAALAASYLCACGLPLVTQGMDRDALVSSVQRLIQEFLDTELGGITIQDWLGNVWDLTVMAGKLIMGRPLTEEFVSFAQWVAGKYATQAGENAVYGNDCLVSEDGTTYVFSAYHIDNGKTVLDSLGTSVPIGATISLRNGYYVVTSLSDTNYLRVASYKRIQGSEVGKHLVSVSFPPVCVSSDCILTFGLCTDGISVFIYDPVKNMSYSPAVIFQGDIAVEVLGENSLSIDRAPSMSYIPEGIEAEQGIALDVGAAATMDLDLVLQGVLDDVLAKTLTSTMTAAEEGTENPPVEEEVPDVDNLGLPALGAALTSRFPFSIPWDFFRAVQLLAAPAKAPYFEVDFMEPLADEVGGWQGDTTVVLDFSEYAIIGQISRWTSTIGFCLMLAGATKRLIWTA